MLRGCKGQSATEFAVLGSLIIIAFSFLIQYSEKINRQQSYLQQAFRQSLKESRDHNTSASYTKVAYRRMPNVSTPMELGQQQQFSSSARVLWQDGNNLLLNREPEEDEDEEDVPKHPAPPRVIYQLNEDSVIDLSPPDNEYDEEGYVILPDEPMEGETETSTDVFTSRTEGRAIFTKQEGQQGSAGITTTRVLSAADIITAEVNLDGKIHTFKHILGPDGKYYIYDETLFDPQRYDEEGVPRNKDSTPWPFERGAILR